MEIYSDGVKFTVRHIENAFEVSANQKKIFA